MIPYSLNNGTLVVGKARRAVVLPLPVEEVIDYDDILVVRVKPTSELTQNVFGIDATGHVVWQIPELPMNKLRDTYLSIRRESTASVAGYYSLGFIIHFDPRTGQILSGDFTK